MWPVLPNALRALWLYDSDDNIDFYSMCPLSKLHNSQKWQLSQKSPKIKVVEDLKHYNFPKGQPMFW
jgi:hypothetical protein